VPAGTFSFAAGDFVRLFDNGFRSFRCTSRGGICTGEINRNS